MSLIEVESALTMPRHRLDPELVHTFMFPPPPAPEFGRFHPAVVAAIKCVPSVAACRDLPFVKLASREPEALKLWITQELIFTNPFSQVLLQVASRITNPAIRDMVFEVAYGEHGPVNHENHTAEEAHPWLLHHLRIAAGIPVEAVQPLPETVTFLDQLFAECASDKPLIGVVAALGVGNERFILTEYKALEEAFQIALPQVARDFFEANIAEDGEHSRLLAQLATILIETSPNPKAAAATYVSTAKRSLQQRLDYYQALFETTCVLTGRNPIDVLATLDGGAGVGL